MYYVIYGFLYTVSLLPLRVLYLLSDLSFFVIYYITGYRREVVMSNLAIAFPEKSLEERKKIAKQFYLNFTDTFIETVKMLSIGPKELARRGVCDTEYLNSLIDQGKNIHIMAGHQFNWEFANLMYARTLKIPFIGIYMPVNNKIFDRIFFKSRSRYGTIMVSAWEFAAKMPQLFKEQYIMALAADQNPGVPAKAYWLNFFSKPAPFVTGPGKGAVKNNTAVVYVGFHKIKRGYYSFKAIPLVENGSDHTPEELTMLYRNALEQTIRENPSNYLWSHRRWRHEWKEGYTEILG
jgi:KDO2-lipid IV(A) lauroyltransferase